MDILCWRRHFAAPTTQTDKVTQDSLQGNCVYFVCSLMVVQYDLQILGLMELGISVIIEVKRTHSVLLRKYLEQSSDGLFSVQKRTPSSHRAPPHSGTLCTPPRIHVSRSVSPTSPSLTGKDGPVTELRFLQRAWSVWAELNFRLVGAWYNQVKLCLGQWHLVK